LLHPGGRQSCHAAADGHHPVLRGPADGDEPAGRPQLRGRGSEGASGSRPGRGRTAAQGRRGRRHRPRRGRRAREIRGRGDERSDLMATIEQPGATATGDAAVAGGQPTSEWTRRWQRILRNRMASVSVACIIVVAVVALASQLIAPYGYATIPRGQELLPSFTEGFLMGTAPLGRDVFSRLVYSIRTALFIAIAAELISLAVAFVVGLIAGYKGGKYDQI